MFGGECCDFVINNNMGEFEIKVFGELSLFFGSWGFVVFFFKDKEEIRKRFYCFF